MKKSNKIIAGFHLLNMIATAEGQLDGRTDSVIREYLSVESMIRLDLDDELEQIIGLKKDKIEAHFIQKSLDFYDDSSPNEREEFKLFAQDLIRADEEISKVENSLYRLMLQTWRTRDEQKKS